MIDNQTLPACLPGERPGAEARPAGDISRGEPTGAPLQSQSSPPHHILVVDDDGSLRQLVTAVLVRSGYAVDAAEDGAAAWEALNADWYDLMITDNNMPKVTGVELLKKLHSARMGLPVIMATGTMPKAEFTRAPWLQPDAVLLKPYTVAEMLQTVKKVLGEAESTTENSQPIMSDELTNHAASQADEPASPPRKSPPKPTHRILVVDEDRDLRQLYADALARPDYAVDVAEDGAAGWEALQANNYQLLITEHDLPNLTGIELVRKLRAAHMALPVVLAAGRLPTHELAQNPALQFAATLVKPFAVEALLDTVENVLRATVSPPEQVDPLPNWKRSPSAIGF